MTGSNILAWNIKTYDDYIVIFLKNKMESLSQQFIKGYSAKYPESTVLAVINRGKKMIEKCIFLATIVLMGAVYKGKVEKTACYSFSVITLIAMMWGR